MPRAGYMRIRGELGKFRVRVGATTVPSGLWPMGWVQLPEGAAPR